MQKKKKKMLLDFCRRCIKHVITEKESMCGAPDKNWKSWHHGALKAAKLKGRVCEMFAAVFQGLEEFLGIDHIYKDSGASLAVNSC